MGLVSCADRASRIGDVRSSTVQTASLVKSHTVVIPYLTELKTRIVTLDTLRRIYVDEDKKRCSCIARLGDFFADSLAAPESTKRCPPGVVDQH
jgi:hypothetical protein